MKSKDKKGFIIGVDLGQAQDYTAISILEKIEKFGYIRNQYKEAMYFCRYLERVALNTPYPSIVEKVVKIYKKLKEEPATGRPMLILDSTGVGRPVFDMFKETEIRPAGINIHGGSTVTKDGPFHNVPKRDLVGVLQVLFQTGRLKVSEQLPDAKTLIDELLNFKVKININTAHDSYEAWREGIHDDLVLAVACAAWWGEKRGSGIEFLR